MTVTNIRRYTSSRWSLLSTVDVRVHRNNFPWICWYEKISKNLNTFTVCLYESLHLVWQSVTNLQIRFSSGIFAVGLYLTVNSCTINDRLEIMFSTTWITFRSWGYHWWNVCVWHFPHKITVITTTQLNIINLVYILTYRPGWTNHSIIVHVFQLNVMIALVVQIS
jgi:hypothetical protein